MISARVRRSPAFDGSNASKVFRSPSSTSFVGVISSVLDERACGRKPHNLLNFFEIIIAVVGNVILLVLVLVIAWIPRDSECGFVVEIIVFIVF